MYVLSKRSFVAPYSHPGYFGKVGMRTFHMTKQRSFCPTINLDKIWSLVSEQTRQKYKDAKPDGKVPVIDVVRAVSSSSALESNSHPSLVDDGSVQTIYQ